MSILQGFINRLQARKQTLAAELETPPQSPMETADSLIAQGNQAESAGNPEEACNLYRQAIAAAPAYAKAHLNLGIGLEAAVQTGPAAEAYRAALAIDAADAYANYNLGKLRLTQGNPVEAEPLLRRALESRPQFPEAHVVLAGLLSGRGDLAAAAAELELALQARPDYVGALLNYAEILVKLNRPVDAESALQRAVAIDLRSVDANFELAGLLMKRSEMKSAEECLRRAVDIKPDFVEAHAALSEVCEALGNIPGAAAALETVIKHRPDWVDAIYNLGRVRQAQMRLGDAEAAFRRVIALDPTHVASIRLLGGVLIGQCRLQEALELYKTGRERCGNAPDIETAELFALFCSENVSRDTVFERHQEFGARLQAAHPPRFAPFGNNPDPGRRLRVGYVSGDFHYHVVSLFLIPLLEHHDRSAIETYCYSLGGKDDKVTQQLRAQAAVWRDASKMSDTELADAIHADHVDILVDLAGYSGVPHPIVFAQRPAPVQANWLGYLNTTGMTCMQYRISDDHCDPSQLADRYHTERLARLPNSQWCYRPFVTVDHATAPPCVNNGYVTFGSFNQTVKLSQTVRRLWAEILRQLPNARLTVAGVHQQRAREDLTRDLVNLGVAMNRVDILPFMSLQDYYQQYDAVDIALDTTPYSGGTTTLDALWMGVPVLTVPGERSSSRSAASILKTAGLTDWIAASPEEYMRHAVQFARDTQGIVELRKTLRARVRQSPLMDEPRFARDMENLYRNMWRNWCKGEERQSC